MRRRKFIIGAGSLAAGSVAALGTGAFTSVTANRDVTVNVAGDESALLALEPCDTSEHPNGEYASVDDDGQFTITIPNLNGRAFTEIDNVFTITNQGTQAVVVYIQEFGEKTVVADVGVRAGQLETGPSDEGTSGEGIAGDDVFDVSSPSSPGYGNIGIKLDAGQSVKLGIYADTSDDNVNDGVGKSSGDSYTGNQEIWDRLTIYADAEKADSGEYQYDADTA